MTFASSLESVCVWRSTRLPGTRFLLLAALLVWAATAEAHAIGAATGAAFLIAVSLIAQFRLWDDLVDRALDCHTHPERVIVRAPSRGPFVYSVWGLGAVNAVALLALQGIHECLAFVSLCAITALWYAEHRRRRLTHVLVLHLKYPAFVLLVAPAQPVSALAGAAIVYAALVAFELLDEPPLRNAAGLAVLFSGLFALALAPLAVDETYYGPAATLTLLVIVVAIGLRLRRARDTAALRYLPFVLASIGLAFVTLGASR